jgi:two-component system chemotaxis response regulator CheY
VSVKHVLSVGQCGFDHSAINRFLGEHFEVKVTPSATAADATRQLNQQPYDLILVNRQFDADGSEGLDFIRQLKAAPELQPIPVMLVTNFREYAQQAESLGAVAGFGKSELGSPALAKRLVPYLGEAAVSQ